MTILYMNKKRANIKAKKNKYLKAVQYIANMQQYRCMNTSD